MNQSQIDININLPEKIIGCIQPAPYKVLHGGRGGGKSRGIAQVLVADGVRDKHLILCTRELQKSIKDSVHRILSNTIDEMGLGPGGNNFYRVEKQGIYGANGTEFIFHGLRNNAAEIKSTEGITRVWCEEAENISESSWDLLIPTIRTNGAEIWISFNPDDELGETWNRFVVDPPEGAYVEEINYWENPWFPDILRKQMEETKKKNYQKYLHIWCGKPNADFEDSIILPAWFDSAIDAHKILKLEERGDRVAAFDPADDGGDAKAVAVRRGPIVLGMEDWYEGDLTTAIPKAFDYAEDHKAGAFIYDNVGIGASIKVALSMLEDKTQPMNYVGFGGGDGVDLPEALFDGEKKNKDMFLNKRAQYYWLLRRKFENTHTAVTAAKNGDLAKLMLFKPEELISLKSDGIKNIKKLKSELCKVKRKRTIGQSKIQIMSKQEMRQNDIPSPNMADTLMMLFAEGPGLVKQKKRKPINYKTAQYA